MTKTFPLTIAAIIYRIGAIVFIGSWASCSPSYQVAQQEISTYEVRAKGQAASTELEALIRPYRTELEGEMNEVIGELAAPISKLRPESTLGNFLCDAMLQYCQKTVDLDVDFATLNYGGVRISSLGSGPLMVGRVFELMPFDNMLVVMDLEGKILMQLLEVIAKAGGWPVSNGIHFVIDERAPTQIMVKEKPINLDQSYRVALPDYVADGGGGCSFLRDLPRSELEPVLIRDLLIDEIRAMGKRGKLEAKIEGRIKMASG